MIKFKSKDEQQKNKEHITNISFIEATFYMKITIFILIFDLFTYVVALQFNSFDFGIFFEIFSLLFAILAVLSLNKKELHSSKTNIILSTIPILFLQLYDIIVMFIEWEGYLFNILFGYVYLKDILGLSLLFILALNAISYLTIKRLDNLSDTNKSKNWFYEEL